MHVAAVLSKSPSRKGMAARRQSFVARSPKGSALTSPKSTARGPGLVPAAVVLTPRGSAAVSGSALGGPPLSRRQSVAGGSLSRMTAAATGAKSGMQGLQKGLLGTAPISEGWTASQVRQHRTPAILGLLHLLAGICSRGHFVQSLISRTSGASGLYLCCRARILLAMLRPMPWQTSCASRRVPWCQAKMARQALSATRPGMQVASLIAPADGHSLR